MPIPVAIGAAAITAGGGLANSIGQHQTNKQNQRFANEMYNRQKADNLEFWHLQNAYNSPSAQMARYKEAGLNPNLIYGQSNTAGSISTPDVQQGTSRSPEWGNAMSAGALTYLNGIYDLDIKQAQLDNLREQNHVIVEDANLRRAQTYATQTSGDRSKFNLDFESELRNISAESRKEQLRQLKNRIDQDMDENARRAVKNVSDIKEAAERMKTMALSRAQTREEIIRIRENVRQMQKDGTLKELDIELRRMGLNPSDPTWQRVAGQALSKLFESDNVFSRFFNRPK